MELMSGYMLLLLLFSSLVVSDSFATLWTVACQAPLFMGFPRQEYWGGLPFLSPSCEVYEVLKEMRKYNNIKRILVT